jgi:hypothetical protein
VANIDDCVALQRGMCTVNPRRALTERTAQHSTAAYVPELMAWQDTALLRSDSISLLLRVSEAFSSSTCVIGYYEVQQCKKYCVNTARHTVTE